MGKIRPKIVGDQGTEQKQKEQAKIRREEKKRRGTLVDVSKKDEQPKEEVKDVQKARKGEKKVAIAKTRGKKYQEARKHVDGKKTYALDEAIKLLKKIK